MNVASDTLSLRCKENMQVNVLSKLELLAWAK